jgi:hypothetical protein
MEYVPIERVPIPLNCIYELVDTQTACTNGLSSNTEDPKAAMKPWNRRMGFPDYEQIFQGFWNMGCKFSRNLWITLNEKIKKIYPDSVQIKSMPRRKIPNDAYTCLDLPLLVL